MKRSVAWGVCAVLLGACGPDAIAPTRARPPVIDAARIDANEHNVLSAVVTVAVHDADSVVVRYRPFTAPAADEARTPSVPIVDGVTTVQVQMLGLLAETRYATVVVAYGKGGTVTGDPLDLATAPLPADIPRFVADGTGPLPGYVLFATSAYTVVIDNGGRVVWYRRYAGSPGLNFEAQPNGHYVVRPTTPDPGDIEPWLELDPLGNITRTMTCANGLQPRLHDLIVEQDGSYRLLCDETRTMDLSAVGGVASARVTGTVIQHLGPTGALLDQWSPFDHFEITDVDLEERRGANVNWTHGNALEKDADGNLLLSSRNLNEITKINATTGAVMWRLGGRRNQFTFLDTPAPAFAHQHGLRSAGASTLLLLDNIGNPAESRAERYVIDEIARTARLVQSYGSVPGVVTEIGGSVQPLAGGHTLVSFGTAGRVEEYDAEGRMVWRIVGNPGYVFRAQRILSLYAPGVGTSR